MTDYIPEGSCGDCGQALPGSLCDLIAELTAMKDRINEMITQVQGIGPDAQGHVHLPFSEDISDSTLGISGTFAGGHAVLQVKAIADNADETASNAQDIAQIAADAANSASQSASGALAAAQTADRKAEGASAAAGLALTAAEGIGPSVTFDDPSRKLTVEVNGKTAEAVIPGGGGGTAGGVSDVQVSSDASDVYLTVTKDGATDLQEIGAVSASAAGVLTPVQYQEISDNLDSLGESLNSKLDRSGGTMTGALTLANSGIVMPDGSKIVTSNDGHILHYSNFALSIGGSECEIIFNSARRPNYQGISPIALTSDLNSLNNRIKALEDIPNANGRSY